MRPFLSASLISLIASGALADEFTLDSSVSAVTIYPSGATITRSMEFNIPAGRHNLVISDIPYEFTRESLRIFGGSGLVFGASQIVSARVQPDDLQLERREELENQIESLQAQIVIKQEESAMAGLRINAAAAQVKLLDSIGNQQAQGAAIALETGNISVDTLTALVSLVGTETLNALEGAQEARAEISAINRTMEVFHKDLLNAKEELARMVAPAEWSYGISLEVEASAEISGTLQISYVTDEAEWRPVYDFTLDTDSESIQVERKVMIGQYTGEDWINAAITVSTSAPFDWQSFSLPYANLARFEPPLPPAPMRTMEMDSVRSAAVASPEFVAVAEPASMAGANLNFQGITATYNLPAGTAIFANNEGVLVTLSRSGFSVDISARADMGANSDTAFLIAELTNSSDEPFLPGEASFFRDGAFVSRAEIAMIAAGATADLGFGRVDGLMVKRSTLRREDGSSGVLTTSNDRIVEYELNVENITNRAWDLVIYDRVPYSEQEDLLIDWTARPRPTETDVEGRRGVLAWAFPLESGESQAVRFSYELNWPEGNQLRVNH